MLKPVKPPYTIEPKRPYRSALRRDQAQLTRARILDAAEELFLANGFGSSTIAAIADRAGVAADTVYASFGSKRGVLKTLMDVRVVGDDEPVALLDRVGPAAANAETDQNRRVEMVAADIAGIHERTRRIDDLMLSAAGNDPEIAALRVDIQQRQRLAGIHRAVSVIQGPDALRAGLSPDQAVDVLWAIAGPDLHRLLRQQRQWTPDQYRDWLTDAIRRLLLP
jgi:AcrR family transcriptional regulator